MPGVIDALHTFFMLRPNLRWIDFEAAIAGAIRDRMAICQALGGENS